MIDIQKLKEHYKSAEAERVVQTIASDKSSNKIPPHFNTGDLDVKIFKPGADNLIRILPRIASDDSDDRYGFAFEINKFFLGGRSVLASNTLNKNLTCPLMKKFFDAHNAKDLETKATFRPQHRFVVWIENYSNIEEDGTPTLELYDMPKTLFDDIMVRAVDKRTKKVVDITHPISGRQIYFAATGEGVERRYTGVEIYGDEVPIKDLYDLPHFNDLLVIPSIEECNSLVAAHTQLATYKDAELPEEGVI